VPSVYEGFGLPAAEAMACGVPVVSSDGGSLPEVVGYDGDGIIVPKKDSRALAEAIKKLLDDPGMRQEMGLKGYKRVMERFTWKKMAVATAEVYEEAVKRVRHAHG